MGDEDHDGDPDSDRSEGNGQAVVSRLRRKLFERASRPPDRAWKVRRR